MNPNLCRIVLRPRGAFETFDLSWRLLRERVRPVGWLVAVTLLPLWLVLSVACWLLEGHPGLVVPALILGGALRAPFTVLFGRLLFSSDIRVRDVLWDLAGQLPAVLVLWALQAASWLAAAATCFVALPWVQAALLYLPETVLLERVGAQRGLRRSARLAGGHVGHAMAGALGTLVLTGWFAAMGEASGQAIVSYVLQLGAPFGSVMGGYVTPWLIGGLLVVQPLIASYRLLLYVDVRTRAEGWDLQVGLRAAGMAA